MARIVVTTPAQELEQLQLAAARQDVADGRRGRWRAWVGLGLAAVSATFATLGYVAPPERPEQCVVAPSPAPPR